MLTVALILGLLGAGTAWAGEDPASVNTDSTEVSVWRIGRGGAYFNGIAIKTPKHLLVFDFCPELPGTVSDTQPGILRDGHVLGPKELENEDLIVFITHAHGDHYDPVIKKLVGKVKKLRYFVPKAMKQEFAEKELAGHTTVLGPGGKSQSDGLTVFPVCTTKDAEGCCYLVETDGIVVLYINTCYSGPGNPTEWLQDLRRDLGQRRIDIACIGLCGNEPRFPKDDLPRLIVPVHPESCTVEEAKVWDNTTVPPKQFFMKNGERYKYKIPVVETPPEKK